MIKNNPVKSFFKFINYKKLILLSYKKIKKENLNLLTKINNELMMVDFISIDEYKKFKINDLNISYNDFQNSIRQYYFTKLLNFRVNKFILIFKSLNLSLIYPLPRKQLQILNKYIKVNFFLSGFAYFILSFYEILKSLINIVNLYLHSKNFEYIDDGAYFFKLKNKNLVTNNFNNFGLVNYAFTNFLNEKNTFIHSIKNFKSDKLKYSKSIFKLEYSNKNLITLFSLFANFIKISLFEKNFSLFFFFREISICFLLNNQKNKSFYDSYFFSHDNFYRPLWTFIAENKGSMIYLYFYSLNNEFTKYKNYDFRYITPLSLYTWNNFYVWSISHEKYLKKIIPSNDKNNFILKPPVSYFTNNKKIDNIPRVLAFDIVPHSLVNYATYGKPYEYELFWKTSNLFLNDILELSKKYNFKFALKIKRQNNLADKKYMNLIETLISNDNFILYDESFSPEQIISTNSIVICFPFTSPAYFAKNINAKTIYYDPLSIIKNNDLSDIELISGIQNLDKYFLETL